MAAHRALARPADTEQGTTLGAIENGHRAAMPVGNALHDRQAKAIAPAAPRTLAAVIQSRERQEDTLTICFGNPRAIIFHLDAGLLTVTAIAQHQPAPRVTHGIGHQVLDDAVN